MILVGWIGVTFAGEPSSLVFTFPETATAGLALRFHADWNDRSSSEVESQRPLQVRSCGFREDGIFPVPPVRLPGTEVDELFDFAFAVVGLRRVSDLGQERLEAVGPPNGRWRVVIAKPRGDLMLWALEDMGAVVHATIDRWFVAMRQDLAEEVVSWVCADP